MKNNVIIKQNILWKKKTRKGAREISTYKNSFNYINIPLRRRRRLRTVDNNIVELISLLFLFGKS
jgi:hypothetical protein